MSAPKEHENSRDSREVIRLKVEGAGSAVNTLRDQQTARGLSLVCPFPALEVDIPVTFGSGEETRRGSIHRIGVEDDPKSGLPRLRLSVRALPGTAETRATVVSPPGESLLGEASRATPLPEEVNRAETDLSVLVATGDTENLLDELLGGQRGRPSVPSSTSYSGLDPDAGKKDPAWAALGEIPMPGDLSRRAVTRRRKRLAGVAAWAMVAGMIAGGAVVLDRAGVISFEGIGQTALGILERTGRAAAFAEEEPVAAGAEEAGLPAAGAASPVAGGAEYQSVAGLVWEGGAVAEEMIDEVAKEEVASRKPEEAPVAEELAAVAAAGPGDDGAPSGEEATGEGAGEVTMMLPTRWPAEYSTAYRLRDPNGIVVDVPGGLVRREGWLDVAAGHSMIRSVRAVQRESGARFVIYVNGDLPRFATAPMAAGVQLRLYRENDHEPVVTEQVAMAR